MKVILLKDVKDVGKCGDIKTVKNGFALNFLVPQKLASPATKSNLTRVEHIKKSLEKTKKTEIDKLKTLADQLAKQSFNIQVKTGTTDKIFGSVTKEDIADTIFQVANLKIDKHDIVLADDIKETGVYNIELKLKSDKFPEEISELAKLKIWVVSDSAKQ
jgi:large subunit ribosomal protein L9